MSTITDEPAERPGTARIVDAPSTATSAHAASLRSPPWSRWRADRDIWRRRLVVALGAIWILDGLLQFQPSMYSRSGDSFAGTVLQYNTMGKPNPLTDLIRFAVTFTYGDAGHQVLFNTLAACVQLAIGVGLLVRRTERPALAASACWAVVPWVVGEALGQMVFPQSNMAITGAPGAALIYIVLSLALWPRRTPGERSPSHHERTRAVGVDHCARSSAVISSPTGPLEDMPAGSDRAPSGVGRRSPLRCDHRARAVDAMHSSDVAGTGLLGRAGARLIWVAIWVGTALLELEHGNWAPDAISAQLRELAHREPAVLGALDRIMARASFGHGTEIALVMALVQVWVGVAALRPATRDAALGVGIVVSLTYWVLGQNFGGLLTGTATDPNLGPLMVLFALALWPRPWRSPSGVPPGAEKPPDLQAAPSPATAHLVVADGAPQPSTSSPLLS